MRHQKRGCIEYVYYFKCWGSHNLEGNKYRFQHREFGRTEAYMKANVTYIKFVAVRDHRTSDICNAMHGGILPVSWMVETRDKLINAKDLEKVRNIAP